MRKLRKFIVKNAFKDFLPERSDFEIIEEKLPKPRPGEFLVKAEYISVDPYMRSFASEQEPPYEQFGFQVGKVIESKNDEYQVNTYVFSHSGWRDHVLLTDHPDDMFKIKPYKPEIGYLPLSLAIGALGMPGITAYLGLLDICQPKQHEVICVTSAAGAVGSLVGQIAKLKGCTVIGFTGSNQKVQFLKQELGFHYAFNYKMDNVKECLSTSAPNGIDCFFDNVGGNLASIIMENMNELGRVAICGSISTYGQESYRQRRPKTRVSVRIEAFSFTQWNWSQQCAALTDLREWLQKGIIKAKETVTNGFEELPDTLIAMLNGDCVGKAVVKI
ncbi:prostaglandin reductase 1-like [Galleria mellonella]|uniref:15-oxoprostaglandin 13-reductase n=1 Tax=Galleria mellonella TaxID=7137 RepID=A0ABM3MYH5_GALME|nr:prostaglandin reductase 1-like [Galleria mellonella]XP_052756405.1 prostaglandin reductase 1-like [Galleria mellonella]